MRQSLKDDRKHCTSVFTTPERVNTRSQQLDKSQQERQVQQQKTCPEVQADFLRPVLDSLAQTKNLRQQNPVPAFHSAG